MAVDIAIDYNTGDLLIAPNKGIEIRAAQNTVDQRIRTRLKVYGGEWELDPSGGLLGSRLRDTLRLPIWRAKQEIPLVVREALEPMDDIRVGEVLADVDPDNSRAIRLTIFYAMLEDDESVSEETLSTSLSIEG